MDKFTNVAFTIGTLDNFYIRSTIFRVLKENLHSFSGKLLDIGCGKMPYKEHILQHSNVQEYIGLDIETALAYDAVVRPDIFWDGVVMPIQDSMYNCAFGTEVLEHCPEPEVILKEVYRVLKTDGFLFGTVPFLWPLHEVPHDEYRYTPYSLRRHLENSGFDDIVIKATGGWHGAMAQMLGLWVRRSPMSVKKRKFLSYLLKPIIGKLIKLDKPENIDFKRSEMITGLYFTAIKK